MKKLHLSVLATALSAVASSAADPPPPRERPAPADRKIEFASDIKPILDRSCTKCHANGKRVLLSLGGAAGSYGFTSDAEAEQFAQTVWDMFLGGSSAVRPFGSVALDVVPPDRYGVIAGGDVTDVNCFGVRGSTQAIMTAGTLPAMTAVELTPVSPASGRLDLDLGGDL